MLNNVVQTPSSKLALDSHEKIDRRQRFSRSPHPYHRNSAESPRDKSTSPKVSSGRGLENAPLHSQGISKSHGPDYFDTDGRKRRKLYTSPSESGTEADDERPSFLKGLPAPPSRPRKGLRGDKGFGAAATSSPYLTPSYLDEYHSTAPKAKLKRLVSTQDQAAAKEEARQILEKYTKRRRAELGRRVIESILLAGVGYFTFCSSEPDLQTGMSTRPEVSKWQIINGIVELKCHLFLVAGIYLTYVLRLVWLEGRKAYLQRTSFGFRFPVSYDPAPLLYPVFLPLLIACSLPSEDAQLAFANLVLSISSVPIHVIPMYEYGYDSLLWTISSLPSTLLRIAQVDLSKGVPVSVCNRIDQEMLVLLYPLHQALKQTLRFLTTTSLLPAELELLSVALINVLMFSSSPQSEILKALLWIGSLTLFIFCRHVLRWTVELARVPSWRFRRSPQTQRKGNILVCAIHDTMGGLLTKLNLSRTCRESSDSDDFQHISRYKVHRKSSRREAKDPGVDRAVQGPEILGNAFTVDDIVQIPSNRSIRNIGSTVEDQSRQRRNTLPTYLADTIQNSGLVDSIYRIRSRPLPTRPKSFVSLTIAQATVLKWVYAIYVYLVVAAVVAFPISGYISQWSLYGHEPVGWALGYLFGDIPAFRLQIIMCNLEGWICLPPRTLDPALQACRGERFRQYFLGAANTRLLICVYCVASITAGLFTVFRLSALVEVDTRRKVFHGMMVIMFLPTVFLDPPFTALAFALILAIFLLLDLFRASQLPPVSKPLTYFLAPYVDGRDHRGPIIVSHIFLLIGCAIPTWLSLAATGRIGPALFEGWDVVTRDLSMITGIVCVGMGDAAASLIGRRYGRRRWPWSGGKSLEGSIAFAVAVVIGLGTARAWLLIGGWKGDSGDGWLLMLGKAAIAAGVSSMTEAVLTGANDNTVVPLILWLVVRGLRI
ncbi:hypothetical protein MMC26_006548 [Xylographa opegraphella]|nr:hypothetical protein [Xylographa opegraphella]